jgi:hypothetical protein
MFRRAPRKLVTIIVFQQRPAALALGQVFFLPHIESLEDDHPNRRFVGAMALVARAIQSGEHPGPYTDETAERIARDGLMPAEDFLRLSEIDDWALAEWFAVPLEQVALRRAELNATAPWP